jgi:hypothetical protein
LKETVPKAWNKIIAEPDGLLIELISETTEKLCGFKAESQLIEDFLSAHRDRLTIGEALGPRPSPPARATAPRAVPQAVRPDYTGGKVSYTGKKVSSFSFRGSHYEVRAWKELLLGLCGILRAARPTEFERILELKGRKRPYFTRDASELRVPERFQNTNVFVETNLSSDQIVKICFAALDLFGYSRNDLWIEFH